MSDTISPFFTGENSTTTVCQALPSGGQSRLTNERIRGCVPVHHLHGAIPSATIHPGASAAIRRCWKHQIQPSNAVCFPWRPGRFSAVWDQWLQYVDRRGIQSESLLLGLHPPPWPARRDPCDEIERREHTRDQCGSGEEICGASLPTDRSLLCQHHRHRGRPEGEICRGRERQTVSKDSLASMSDTSTY